MAGKTLEHKEAELMANPEFRVAYDALKDEFRLARQMIEARSRAGLTQKEVAERMHTTQSAVARLESGKGAASTKTLERYAEAIGARLCYHFQFAC